MDGCKASGGLTVMLAMIAAPAAAKTEELAPIDASASSRFSLMSPSVAPPRDISLRPAAAGPRKPGVFMPREVPAVAVDDATPLPVPGYDWRTPIGGLVRLRPTKLRFRLGF